MGSKIPAFNPWRLTEDKKLQDAIANFSHTGKTLFLIAHFDHPRELTEEAKDQLRMFRELGVVVVNQCPILHGINDDPAILAELYNSLNSVGVAPYYLFQGRPTKGNAMFRVPLVKSYEIFHEAVSSLSGLAKRARLVMSHATGKIEIIAVDDSRIYMRYHRAKYEEDRERFMIFHRDDMAYWLDDLVPAESMIRQNETQWV
jgi:L-lysine 2,3-aminomutase